jgi:hypothetical protein
MAVRQVENHPRAEVRARISADLHRRMLDECGLCACHVSGFIAMAIAHEVASRRKTRKEAADDYLRTVAVEFMGSTDA